MVNIKKTGPVPSILKNRRNYVSITKLKNKPKKLGNRRQAGQQAAGSRRQAGRVGPQAASFRQQATGGRRQAASSHGSLTRRQQAGGWARRPQAPGPRSLNKVLWTLDRGSWL